MISTSLLSTLPSDVANSTTVALRSNRSAGQQHFDNVVARIEQNIDPNEKDGNDDTCVIQFSDEEVDLCRKISENGNKTKVYAIALKAAWIQKGYITEATTFEDFCDSKNPQMKALMEVFKKQLEIGFLSTSKSLGYNLSQYEVFYYCTTMPTLLGYFKQMNATAPSAEDAQDFVNLAANLKRALRNLQNTVLSFFGLEGFKTSKKRKPLEILSPEQRVAKLNESKKRLNQLNDKLSTNRVAQAPNTVAKPVSNAPKPAPSNVDTVANKPPAPVFPDAPLVGMDSMDVVDDNASNISGFSSLEIENPEVDETGRRLYDAIEILAKQFAKELQDWTKGLSINYKADAGELVCGEDCFTFKNVFPGGQVKKVIKATSKLPIEELY